MLQFPNMMQIKICFLEIAFRCVATLWMVCPEDTERTTRRTGENKALINWSAWCASWLICHNFQTVECFHRFYHVRVWMLLRLPNDLQRFHPMRKRVPANCPIRSRARANMVEPQIASRRDSFRVWWSNPSVNLSLTALLCVGVWLNQGTSDEERWREVGRGRMTRWMNNWWWRREEEQINRREIRM